MKKAATAAAVLVVLVLFLAVPNPAGSLHYRLAAAGCRDVLVDHQRLARADILAVSARECIRPDGEVLAADRAIDLIGETAWHWYARRYDALHVDVFSSASEPDVTQLVSREFSRRELALLWGPRAAGLDRGATRDPFSGELLWLALPIGYLLVSVVIITAGVRAARSGWIGFIIWIRR